MNISRDRGRGILPLCACLFLDCEEILLVLGTPLRAEVKYFRSFRDGAARWTQDAHRSTRVNAAWRSASFLRDADGRSVVFRVQGSTDSLFLR